VVAAAGGGLILMGVTAPADRRGVGPADDGSITLDALDADPYPIYRQLRERGVVWVEAVDRWLVTRWEDVDRVERDAASFTAREAGSLQTRVMGRTMLRVDGAEHRRLRAAAKEPLSPRTVEAEWLPRFRMFADELIDAFPCDGAVDLMRAYCGPLAARCLGAVLGLTGVSDDELQFWSQALMDGTANYGDRPDVWERTERAVDEIEAATAEALERVRSAPDASLISAMAHADGGGEALTDAEILSNVMLIIGGGLNEPRDGLGAGIWALLTHPGQRAEAQDDPSLWPAVTEEALRWISPLAVFPRQARAAVEIGATRLEPGARVGLVVASANRDERHWERPDEFEIDRPRARNVAFGVGQHFCLGVWMARHEIGGAGLPALFTRCPELRLDLDHPPEIRGWVFRGHTRLHVRRGRKVVV